MEILKTVQKYKKKWETVVKTIKNFGEKCEIFWEFPVKNVGKFFRIPMSSLGVCVLFLE